MCRALAYQENPVPAGIRWRRISFSFRPTRLSTRAAKAAREGGGFRAATTLNRLAEQAGLSMLEAHRALHQLFDRKLLQLVDDTLVVPDLEALSACLEGSD